MPSYFTLCSSSSVLIFMMAPSRMPTMNSDSFLVSLKTMAVGKLGNVILWKVYMER